MLNLLLLAIFTCVSRVCVYVCVCLWGGGGGGGGAGGKVSYPVTLKKVQI